MAFDQPTRRLLENLVSDARRFLVEEFRHQLRTTCGLDPVSGAVIPLERLVDVDDARLETARLLQETVAHYQATSPQGGGVEAIDRVLREQAFTVLNRLAALRMAEARGLVLEAVGKGYDSRGFRLYSQVAGPALGDTADRYRNFLFSLFDELAIDLPVLFDRYAPQGRLFPGETALQGLFKLLNDPAIEPLWAEDETVGWIYQYFNSKEERKKMRDESAAPRNSRELAVRNQFFTPRYVVEFLTDNTLGRTWYEMTKGATRLAETCRYLVRRPSEVFLRVGEAAPVESEPDADLSQEELLKRTVHVPHRPLKDPREIRMLDPACGSMHFGLYAFDLYLVIYEEAWDLGDALPVAQGLPPLREVYESREAFLQDVPRLVLEHNIHGIDIDPRAVQIAGLSLWLRAQRAWLEQGLKASERPPIRKSSVVCAEPMPGEQAFLEEFLSSELAHTPEDRVLGHLVRKVFEAMKLAGEAGALLKIEEEIAGSVTEARKKWVAQPRTEQGELFGDLMPVKRYEQLELDLSGVSDWTFWGRAETRIYEALRAYAGRAEQAGGYQRRLFAEDAERGFAFIDLCRRRYDVVLMNPPFGEPSEAIIEHVERGFTSTSKNLLCAFLQYGFSSLSEIGCLGAIYDRTAVVKSSYESFRRESLIPDTRLSTHIDLGWEVLDANVEVCASTLTRTSTPQRAVFIDLRAEPAGTKGTLLFDKLSRLGTGNDASVRQFHGNVFQRFPNAVVGYDFPPFVIKMFHALASFEGWGVQVIAGHTILSDRFFRYWWEIPLEKAFLPDSPWQRFYNGGEYCRYVSLLCDAVLYGLNGELILSQASTIMRNTGLQQKGRVAFGKRGEFIDAHVLPSGFVSSVEGQAVLFHRDADAFVTLGLLNSCLFQAVINLYCGQHKYPGYVHLFPVPHSRADELAAIGACAENIFRCKDGVESVDESNPKFLRKSVVDLFQETFRVNVLSAKKYVAGEEGRLNILVAKAYGIDGEAHDYVAGVAKMQPSTGGVISEDPDRFWAESIVLFIVGTSFGRWDVGFATGEKSAPELPDPFAPLPVCPPGMLQNDQGLPLTREDVRHLKTSGQWTYPIDIPWDGILVDDPGHPLDIESRVRQVLEVIWKERADAIEHEACEILGVPSLREYFRKSSDFFADHLKRYSKSRRQAPIYWPLTTASGRYTLWIYYHRLTDQTLFTCINDFVEPKLVQVAEEIAALKERGGKATEIQKLVDFESELRDFRDELLRLTRLPWKPNLNDGVQITAAPLWRLFGLKPWQKKLQETWKALEKGEYDWAHLALPIWPDRVREKCKKDKSIAIAHDLEALYEEAPAAPKKRGRKTQGATP